jgi:hypothetical protein
LELLELAQDDGVAEGEIRSARIDAELDAQWAPERELRLQSLGGDDLGDAAAQSIQVGGHRADATSAFPENRRSRGTLARDGEGPGATRPVLCARVRRERL